MRIKIEMTHEDGHINIQYRPASEVKRTIELAKQCGYVAFVCSEDNCR